jgi:hypothetical protein
MTEPVSFPTSEPVTELERRIRWRALPTFVFLGLIAALTGVAIVSLVAPPRAITGLPDDPDVRVAQRIARVGLSIPSGSLRFYSALTGDVPPERARLGGVDPAAVAEIRARLMEAHARHPRDVRLRVALAHLDLARHAYESAARGYRAAIDRGDRCPEAHLGLGVTLAQLATLEPDLQQARALELESVAQFAAVGRNDPGHAAALYDRAMQLARVGRRDEARALAARYFTGDRSSVWAARLEEALASPP